MNLVVIFMEAAAALFAVLFVVYYLRILARAREAGPEPVSWIAAAVGFALIAAYAVIEALMVIGSSEVFFQIQRVYFLLGNVIVFGVLYRIWRGTGDGNGW
ncbi:MAG: hypothetical protein ABEI07_01180 [Candidatus Nanohaloarchaea archaeon]